ncbi:MAG TPA: hypothetical protein VFI90_12845 [Rubrobacter sp.]|nr:hypothetical protein [Rubrobacter sp.]
MLSAEQFQEELVLLGLSGKEYGPEEYAEALGAYLGISIAVHVIPDLQYPELSHRLASSGRMGEIRYSEELGIAVIIVPGSLPSLVSVLTVLHELGHLAAGDLLIEPGGGLGNTTPENSGKDAFATVRIEHGKRLAQGFPFAHENLREREANMRASYALTAGCLGSLSPYALKMHDVL